MNPAPARLLRVLLTLALLGAPAALVAAATSGPATAGPAASAEFRVNTFTTLRKMDGRWYLTSYLESVPYTGPIGGRNRDR